MAQEAQHSDKHAEVAGVFNERYANDEVRQLANELLDTASVMIQGVPEGRRADKQEMWAVAQCHITGICDRRLEQIAEKYSVDDTF